MELGDTDWKPEERYQLSRSINVLFHSTQSLLDTVQHGERRNIYISGFRIPRLLLRGSFFGI